MTSIIKAVRCCEADPGLSMSSLEGSSYGNGILGRTCDAMRVPGAAVPAACKWGAFSS